MPPRRRSADAATTFPGSCSRTACGYPQTACRRRSGAAVLPVSVFTKIGMPLRRRSADAAKTPSGSCSRTACGYPQAACRRRSGAA
eukprot:1770827-Heterocapsa_arctica.AAC.1